MRHFGDCSCGMDDCLACTIQLSNQQREEGEDYLSSALSTLEQARTLLNNQKPISDPLSLTDFDRGLLHAAAISW